MHEQSKLKDINGKSLSRFERPSEGPREANLLAATKNQKTSSAKMGKFMFQP